ncbi:MAG: DUF4878 domain-containing protein, partial [Gordonia sp. (in: high G+C Gram-positive bacteria)]
PAQPQRPAPQQQAQPQRPAPQQQQPQGAAPKSQAPGGQQWSQPHQPKVIPAGADEPKKSKGKLKWIIAAVVLVLIVVAAFLVWFFTVAESDQSKAADATKEYKTAMADGDLSKLRSVTCGELQQYYQGLSDADFARTYESQKKRNEIPEFKDITGVAVDGDTARVGVEVTTTDHGSSTAQITVHKIGGEWKVCDKP